MINNINFEIPVNDENDYPIECFYKDDYEHLECSDLHWHFFSEIIYVNEGEEEITVDNNIYHLKKGDLIYINPHKIHLAYNPNKQKTALTVIKFNSNILLSAINSLKEKTYIEAFVNQNPDYVLLFREKDLNETEIKKIMANVICEYEEKKYAYEYFIHNSCCEIVLILLRVLHKNNIIINSLKKLDAEELQNFNNILSFINKSFDKEIDIKEILKQCNLSYSNFALKFKRLTNKTLKEYINYVRISYSFKMLLTTDLSITEIANNCGFNDVCYFNRVFKRLALKTPTEYRKVCKYKNIGL